jgi:hypothetical protein
MCSPPPPSLLVIPSAFAGAKRRERGRNLLSAAVEGRKQIPHFVRNDKGAGPQAFAGHEVLPP